MGCEVTDEGGEGLAQKSPQPPEDEAEVVAGGGEIGIDAVSKAKKRSDTRAPSRSHEPKKLRGAVTEDWARRFGDNDGTPRQGDPREARTRQSNQVRDLPCLLVAMNGPDSP